METKIKKTKHGTITIRLKRGLSNTRGDQRATVYGLGLRSPGSKRTLENSSCVRGMVKKVIHLLDIVDESR